MSESADDNGIQDRLRQLRCHFTWKLEVEDIEISDLENRVLDQIEFLDIKTSAGMHNLLAYVKHLKGRNEDALQNLKEAEDLIQAQHAEQADRRSLVTWGNYAWVHFRLGRVADAQSYLDRVENTCRMFANHSRYRVECPELDCEEGWALLKCGRKNYERARACFKKALDVEPENPDFSSGYAIVTYRLENSGGMLSSNGQSVSLELLRKAVRLNPDNGYVKVLLALKLQDIGENDEGEKHIEEALNKMSSQIYVYRYAAKFYRRKGCVDEALRFLKKALQATPNSALLHHQMGLCCRAKVIQIKRTANMQPRGQDRETVDRLVNLAIFHFKFALERKPTFNIALLDLARMYIEAKNYEKAEESFQNLFLSKSAEQQTLAEGHLYFGQFQEFQKRSEVDALRHYVKAMKMEKSSFIRDKTAHSLEKMALKKLRRNELDLEGLSLLGFVYKLKGKMNEAMEYYERALSLAADSENMGGHGP